MNILTVNLLFSILVFWIAAKTYVFPKLSELGPKAVLLPILLLHSFRHLGSMLAGLLIQPPGRSDIHRNKFEVPDNSYFAVAAIQWGNALADDRRDFKIDRRLTSFAAWW